MMQGPKRVIILVGPKGSGKSFIGSLIDKELGIPFLRVEPIFLANMRRSRATGDALDAEGYHQVAAAIDRALTGEKCLVIESTGAADAFSDFFLALRARYEVLLVSIKAPPDICLERVHSRDQSTHIAVSDDRVSEINQRAVQVRLPWNLEIDNSGPAEPKAILDEIRGLLARRDQQ